MNTVVIDGKEYEVSKLSPELQNYLKKSKFINTHRYYLKTMILMPFAS